MHPSSNTSKTNLQFQRSCDLIIERRKNVIIAYLPCLYCKMIKITISSPCFELFISPDQCKYLFAHTAT